MIESLQKYAKNATIFVLAFDKTTYDVLESLQFHQIKIISLQDFEDTALLAIKPTRTLGEYCWTCTPSLIAYCIHTFNLPHCTYVDADVYFFENPNVLIDEMQTDSILLTKHNYTPQYNQEATSGIYCVQFMTFKADSYGLKALVWWREQCLKWCYAYYEDGKFGDQKYLDDWDTRFEKVHIVKEMRAALAPWNIQQFSHLKPIFYHFHNLSFIGQTKVDLGNYTLPKVSIERIYKPYLAHLLSLRRTFMPHNFDGRKHLKWHIKTPFTLLKRYLKGIYNIYPLKRLL